MPTDCAQPSVSRMRALKRNRLDLVPDEDRPFEGYFKLRPLPAGPHAPAKSEARALRRICASTGLTPEQVRERHTYRVELAQAASVQRRPGCFGLSTRDQRMLIQRLKQVQRTVRLAHWQPGLKAAFLANWEQLSGHQRHGMSGEQAFAHAMHLKQQRRSARN